MVLYIYIMSKAYRPINKYNEMKN